MTTLAWASAIRVSKASAEKPPKTTECGAPIRAQARSATTASGIIGKVDHHRVALADAEVGQRVGGLLHLAVQVGIGDRPGVAGLADEVDGHLVAAARRDVPVQAVVPAH